jgi:DNA-binding MarR family transcriptional regulator
MSPYLTTTISLVRSSSPDFTARQMAILGLLVEEEALPSVRELSRRLNVHKGVITRASDKLVDLGLILRTTHKVDRRLCVLSATKKGTSYWAATQSAPVKKAA